MRVLLVSHRYPPHHTAGTEVYTEGLACALAQRGHEVHVLCTHKDVGRTDLQVRRREQDGVTVHTLVQNLFYRSFQETWSHPRVEKRFEELLAEVRPEIVHIQHLLYLSAGLPEMAAAAGARVLATLHDFGLECARFGQLVDADGKLCHAVDPMRCGTCLARFDWRQSSLQRRVGRGLAGLRRVTGLNLAPLAVRKGRGSNAAGQIEAPKPIDTDEQERYARGSLARRAGLLEAYRQAERVFCPSAFLAARVIDAGLDAGRVEVLPTGIAKGRMHAAQRVPRALGAPLRVQFLGTFVPLKGAHVALEAWDQLGDELKAGAELRLNGPDEHAPAYAESLAGFASQVGAQMGGRLSRDEVHAALARTDVLVVPSLWFENRPLVILEALQAGALVLASDLGALPELVPEPELRFRAGDATALAACLRRLIRNPELVEAHRPPELPDWEATVDRVEAVYRAPVVS